MTPSLGQIYTAFRPDSHRAFRLAMRLSSSGVLRVDDLVRALLAHQLPPAHPERTSPAAALEQLGTAPAQVRVADRRVPMSIEPALREVLELAWEIAADQSTLESSVPLRSVAGNVWITPACLTASVLLQRGRLPPGSVRQDAFRRLGLRVPATLNGPRNATPRVADDPLMDTAYTVSAGSSPAGSIFVAGSIDEWIDQTLILWLNLQPTAERANPEETRDLQWASIVRIKKLVDLIESSAESEPGRDSTSRNRPSTE